MKNKKTIIMTGLLMAVVSLTIVGCTAPNPNAGQPSVNPATGVTNYEPAVIVDSNRIAQIDANVKAVLAQASALNGATAGYNPYAAPIQGGIDIAKTIEVAVPSVAAGIAALIAFFQNRGKKVQAAAAATLAKSNTNEQAMANAPTPEVQAAIAVHSANAQEVQAVQPATPTYSGPVSPGGPRL